MSSDAFSRHSALASNVCLVARKTPGDNSPRIVNRRARYEYHILETLETGIVLVGSEVKSVRHGQVSLAEGYARVDPVDMGLYLYDVDIAAYFHAGPNQHETKRRRRLLARHREIQKIHTATGTSGTTLVPLAMYFQRGWIKVEIGVARGKRQHDKRQDIRDRDAQARIRHAMTRKRL